MSTAKRTWSARLMPTESPQHPQPDELPEDQRTGDEPNPSGHAPAPSAPRKADRCSGAVIPVTGGRPML